MEMLYGITLQKINMADWLKEQHPIETEGKLIKSSVTNAKISSSNISWTGYGEIGWYSLIGKIGLKDANIRLEKDSLTAATISIDMTSITHENKNLENP